MSTVFAPNGSLSMLAAPFWCHSNRAIQAYNFAFVFLPFGLDFCAFSCAAFSTCTLALRRLSTRAMAAARCWPSTLRLSPPTTGPPPRRHTWWVRWVGVPQPRRAPPPSIMPRLGFIGSHTARGEIVYCRWPSASYKPTYPANLCPFFAYG